MKKEQLEQLSKEELIEILLQTLPLVEKNSQLEKRIAQLESELRKYKNENTPSSAIPYFEKENLNHRHRHSGQKEGHKGASRKTPDKIDRVVPLILEVSPCCNQPVKKMKAKPKTRVVTHLLNPKIENVKYLKNRYICTCCGKEVQPEVPNAIPNARFDLSFMILISVLSVGMNLPFGKIKQLLKFLWGFDVSEATISNQLTKLSCFLGDDYEKLKIEIRNETSRNDDETGHRILGKGAWLWIFISKMVAYYTIEWSRGRKVVKKVLGSRPRGVDTTDGLPSYDRLGSRKQKCWAHILRRFKLITFPFKNKTEKKHFRKLRNSLKLVFKRAKDDKLKLGVSVELREKYEAKLNRILAKNYRGKNIEKILVTLRNQQDELFIFLEFADVDPTNNRAEQALKAPIIKRKISYQSRSMKHAKNYVMQLSIMKTAELRNQNYAEVLEKIIQQQLASGKF